MSQPGCSGDAPGLAAAAPPVPAGAYAVSRSAHRATGAEPVIVSVRTVSGGSPRVRTRKVYKSVVCVADTLPAVGAAARKPLPGGAATAARAPLPGGAARAPLPSTGGAGGAVAGARGDTPRSPSALAMAGSLARSPSIASTFPLCV